MSLVSQLLALSIEKRVKLTCAESCTGGMLATALTDIPGSSEMMERGFVTYTNAAKIEMLGVVPATLAAHGAVSEAVAREMAAGALAHSKAQISVAITGIAGPGGSDHKPEGRVCFAIAHSCKCDAETQEFGARGRDAVRRAARDHALALLLRAAQTMPAAP